MKKRLFVVLSGALAVGALGIPTAQAAPDTHGCALQDGSPVGATPQVYHSDTSTIGGNSCKFTALTNLTDGSGPSYEATAASWSISGCTPQPGGSCLNNPADSYSSSAGSAPVGKPGSLTPGDVITVSVTDGQIVAGTLSSN